jgi:hypothetical protein
MLKMIDTVVPCHATSTDLLLIALGKDCAPVVDRATPHHLDTTLAVHCEHSSTARPIWLDVRSKRLETAWHH